MRTIGNIFLIIFVCATVYTLRSDLAPVAQFLGNSAEKVSGELRQSVFGVKKDSSGALEKNKLLNDKQVLPSIVSKTKNNDVKTSEGLPGPLPVVNESQSLDSSDSELIVVESTGVSIEGIVKATNIEREKMGLSKLQISNVLSSSAQVKAQDMMTHKYFDHVSPNGITLNDLVKDAGYNFLAIGENLAYGNFYTSSGVVTAWMNSPGHRANILSSNYTEIGIGLTRGMYEGSYTWMLVQHFGAPSKLCPEVDQDLKLQVQSYEAQLKETEVLLAQKREVIAQTSSFSFDYDRLIKEYNLLVNEYNNGVSLIKDKISLFNKSVSDYNSCLKNYVH